MKVGHIKGAFLEYIIREILKNCGFTNVSPDDLYTYKNRGLVFVNGKGAAHDTDILPKNKPPDGEGFYQL